MILAVSASPSVDVTYVVDDFRIGAQVRPVSVHRVPGGKAINAARAASTLGTEVRVVAALGGSTGEFIARELSARGIPLAMTATAHDTRTCVSVFSMADATLTEIYEHAPPIADAWPSLLELVTAEGSTTAAPGWMLLSGSLPSTGVDRPLTELSERAAAHGLRLAVDTHGPALSAAIDAPPELAPAMIKVNRAEAAEALKRPVSTSPSALATELRDRTSGIAVVTDGTAGSVAADQHDIWHAQLPGVGGGYPVGSGDSYLGGLLAALDSPDRAVPLAEALRLATAVAAANAAIPGAAEFDPAEVTRLLPDVVIRAG